MISWILLKLKENKIKRRLIWLFSILNVDERMLRGNSPLIWYNFVWFLPLITPLTSASQFQDYKLFTKGGLRLVSFFNQLGNHHGGCQTIILIKTLICKVFLKISHGILSQFNPHGLHRDLKVHLGTKDGEGILMGEFFNLNTKHLHTLSINVHPTCLMHRICPNFSKGITHLTFNNLHYTTSSTTTLAPISQHQSILTADASII